jgi:selenocysteine-specific elongation factor
LAALEQRDTAVALRGLLHLQPGWTDGESFFLSRNVPPPIQQAVMAVAPAALAGGLLITPSSLEALGATVVQCLAEHHAAAPDQPGLQLERLRMAMSECPPPRAFRAIVDSLFRRGAVEQDGPWLRLPAHRATLSAHDERLWLQAHSLIAGDRFRPPRTRDLARALSVPEAGMRTTLKRVQRMGCVIEVAPDQFFFSETVAEMIGIAAAIAENTATGTLSTAEFRDRLGNGRKVAILILEFFDRAGVTVRVGNERRVRADRLRIFGPSPSPQSAARPSVS